MANKINDTSKSITRGSKLERYWENRIFEQYYKKLRPRLNLPKVFFNNDNSSLVLKNYKIKDLGFGNWVTQEDRYNYINALVIAMYDLNKVLKFNNNIGLNMLSITFGARGSGGAVAHFEPRDNIINITRYKDGASYSKEARFVGTGGIGSLAHEYAHFLDYFSGKYLSKGTEFLAITGGRSTSTKRLDDVEALRVIMNNIMEKIIWKDSLKSHSNYYQRLKASQTNEYWFRRTELFARAFEVYISCELKKMGIKNLLLCYQKYDSSVYLKDSEMKLMSKEFDKLILLIKKRL